MARKTKKKRGKKKKENFLVENYRKSFDYLKESRNYIYVIIGIFVLFALIGFLFPVPEEVIAVILDFIREILAKTQGMNAKELSGFIFLNNVRTSFFGMIFGFVFGIYPILATIINGYVVGVVSALSVSSGGVGILWRLVPHGIFELPAIFISLGLGLKFGGFIFAKQKGQAFLYYLANSIRVFACIVIPLLIIAAFIEGALIFYFS